MSFAIVAEFPLGTYRGHRQDGSVDPLPSPARLHAALLAAAAQGVRAEPADGEFAPNRVDRAALAWLESHAPDGIARPHSITNAGRVLAYRAEGFFGVRDKRRVLESKEDHPGAVALAGPIAWVWDEAPPEELASALAALCQEVPYLGTTESPVRLRVESATPTHRLDPDAGLLTGDGLEVEIPRPGRTAVLERAFRAASGRVPSPASDRPSRTEGAVASPSEQAALARARYVPLTAQPADVPWPTVVLLPVDVDIATEDRLAWSVALHRAFVARIGDGAPPLVTGKYAPGVARPVNRLAIQYIPSSIAAAPRLPARGAFALLIPAAADPADLAVLDRAVRGLRELRSGSRRPLRLSRDPVVVAGDSFWAPVPAGHRRVWITGTAAIPESRPLRGRSWTIGDAALLSLGLVYRDRFGRRGSKASWYADVVADLAAAGVAVIDAHKLHGVDVRRYVHRATPAMAVQPYLAALWLGRLAGERTILAIGQTRHLGGGLLVPHDIPVEAAGSGSAEVEG